MVRVFFIYIAESKPHDFIPFFFSRRAKSEIVQIRQAMIDPAILNELQDIYQNIDQFQKKPTSSQAQEVDKQLRAAASKELQCALLALLCWGKAIEKVGGLLY